MREIVLTSHLSPAGSIPGGINLLEEQTPTLQLKLADLLFFSSTLDRLVGYQMRGDKSTIVINRGNAVALRGFHNDGAVTGG
jgi:hypothetical protein